MTDRMHVEDPLVAAVLAAAAAPAEAPMPGEAEALAAFREMHRPTRRLHVIRPSENLKLFAAALCGGVVMISGAAAAATGTLPVVGSSHSSHPHVTKSHAPESDDQDATETDTEDTQGTEDSQGTADAPDTEGSGTDQGKGSEISTLTHSLPQGHKGSAVCTVASEGKCQAGQHGQSDATTHGKSDASHGQDDATTHGKADAATHGQADAATHG